MAVRPVLETSWPVISDPRPMPNVSGSSEQAGFRRRRAADRAQIDRQERDQGDEGRTMAGRQSVAAPDRGLPEQPRRQKRRGVALLLPYEQHEREYAEGQ